MVHRRWIDSIVVCHKVSDRIVYIDMKIFGRKYRIIAVYVPHQGYPVDDFASCFDHLRLTVLDAHREGMQCMLGGDFNTELERGWRGGCLREYLIEVSLKVVNDIMEGHFEETWTFRINMGVKRILDYCMISDGVQVHSWNIPKSFELRFDHRGVQCCMHIPIDVRLDFYEARTKEVDWEQYKKVGATTVLQEGIDVLNLEKEVLPMSSGCPRKVQKGGLRPCDCKVLKCVVPVGMSVLIQLQERYSRSKSKNNCDVICGSIGRNKHKSNWKSSKIKYWESYIYIQ